jgi:hypothetical protein
MEQIMSISCAFFEPADILVLKRASDPYQELARYLVLSSNRQWHREGHGQEQVYTLYTIGTHPFNTPIPGISEKVGTTITLSRGQMINDFTQVWSKLC